MILGFLSTFRDSVIVIWGLLSVLALVFLIMATLSIWFGVRKTMKSLQTTVDTDVKPLLALSQDSATNVAGTTSFLGETVVRPVIRLLSLLSGVRKALAVFAGVTGRGKKSKT